MIFVPNNFLHLSLVADDSNKYMRTSEGLAIKRVTNNDSGEYTCRAYQISATINNVKEQTIRLNIQRMFDNLLIILTRRPTGTVASIRRENSYISNTAFFFQINREGCWRVTIIIMAT